MPPTRSSCLYVLLPYSAITTCSSWRNFLQVINAAQDVGLVPGGLPFPDDAFCRSYRPAAGSLGSSSLGGAAGASPATGAVKTKQYGPLTSGLQPHFDPQGSWGEVSNGSSVRMFT